nr:MAG TPA: hypothetical protein [Caudoviricetes sp.]
MTRLTPTRCGRTFRRPPQTPIRAIGRGMGGLLWRTWTLPAACRRPAIGSSGQERRTEWSAPPAQSWGRGSLRM